MVEVSVEGLEDPVRFAFVETAWAYARLLAETQKIVRVVPAAPV